MEPVSRKRTCKVGPGHFIPQYCRNKIGLVTVSKLKKPTPTTTCVLLVHRIYAINLAHDATVGERSRNSKFSTHHEDQSMEILATRERECIFIPLKIVMQKHYKHAVGGVVHVAIQIAVDSDLSTEQRCLCVQHTCIPGTSPPS